jgi:hypothetical protein
METFLPLVAIRLADEWWPRLQQYARDERFRGLTLESTTLQLSAATALSLLAAYIIVALV